METIFTHLVEKYTLQGILLAALLLAFLLVQLRYYLFVYGRIPAYRNPRRDAAAAEGVSVVVVLAQEDYGYLEDTLPGLLSQDCTDYEIVLVCLGAGEDFRDAVFRIATFHPHLSATFVGQDPRFPISRKMALNMGIKAARYPHIVITTSDCAPVSERWLSLMSRAFAAGDVVIGYCGIAVRRGLSNRLVRGARMGCAMRFFGAAVRGRPYRGLIQNLGFTKEAYFSARGFNFLNLNMGEDDLFVQRLARDRKVAVQMHPQAVMRQQVWGGRRGWYRERKFLGFAFRYYPVGVKWYIGCELWSRFLFFLCAACVLVWMPADLKIFAAAAVAVRYAVVWLEVWRVSKRLGEKGVAAVWPLLDAGTPFYELRLAVMRRLKRPQGVWR